VKLQIDTLWIVTEDAGIRWVDLLGLRAEVLLENGFSNFSKMLLKEFSSLFANLVLLGLEDLGKPP